MKRIAVLPIVVAALAAGLAAALAVPVAASAAPVATPGAATTVREYAGTIAFSQFDPATGQWRLAVRRAGAAAPELVPVAPSRRPFQVDIGPDSSGRPELIYERCLATPGAPSGCDLFVHALDGASGERPVRNANDPRHNDTAPTIWRGRIAWTRDYGAGSTPNPIVYTKALTAPRSRPSTRLPGVPQRRCGDVDTGVCGPTTLRSVRELELWGENLAQTVSYGCGGCSGISQGELRLVDVGDRSARQIAFQIIGLSGQSLVGPSFSGGRVNWYFACLGDPAGCQGGRSGPFRATLTGSRYERGPGGPIEVHGFADAATTQYQVVQCSEETQGPFNAGCHIEQLPEPAYTPTRVRRRG
jgi:hypothetical protein